MDSFESALIQDRIHREFHRNKGKRITGIDKVVMAAFILVEVYMWIDFLMNNSSGGS